MNEKQMADLIYEMIDVGMEENFVIESEISGSNVYFKINSGEKFEIIVKAVE